MTQVGSNFLGSDMQLAADCVARSGGATVASLCRALGEQLYADAEHGGPWPATSAPSATSVGAAISGVLQPLGATP
jgi:hypothetical protein